MIHARVCRSCGTFLHIPPSSLKSLTSPNDLSICIFLHRAVSSVSVYFSGSIFPPWMPLHLSDSLLRDLMRTREVNSNKKKKKRRKETSWQRWIGALCPKPPQRSQKERKNPILTPISVYTWHSQVYCECGDIFNARYKWNAGLIVSGYNLGTRQMLMWGVKGVLVSFFFSPDSLFHWEGLRHFCDAAERIASLLPLYL